MTLDVRSLACGDRNVCEKGGELIRPNYTGKLLYWGNINSLVLTYAPGISVLPARSGFTPGWVYVHVGGGTHCCCCRVLFLTVCSCFLHRTAIVHRETLVTILIESFVHFVAPIR